MALRNKSPLGIGLVSRGVLSEKDIEVAIEYQKDHPNKRIGDIIHTLNLCSSVELIKNMGEILGEKVILLTKDTVKIDLKEYISLDVCKACKAVMFDIDGKS